MSKKQKKQTSIPAPAKEAPVAQPVAAAAPQPLSIYDFKVQAWILAILSLVFYFNSFFNEYAHDDGIVIVKNAYVQEGLSGIPDILTKDAYDSYYRLLNTTNQLSGGRYRPLSIVTFAIEQQFFGTIPENKIDSVLRDNYAYGVKGEQQKKLVHDMHARHVLNVLWYILSVVVLLYFLRYVVFRNAPMMAFIAALLFTIHPIHTEVVANVKSRDEIMSLLFMCLTFIFEFKYRELKDKRMLLAALVSYFLAFLSKEYAITMVVLLPLSLYLFNNFSIKKSLLAFLPYLAVIAVYIAIRAQIVAPAGENSDNEVLNNPYLFASVSEKLATEIATSLNYLKLLIWPHPLSADYSYNSIPYKDFTHPLVWLSLVVHAGLVALMVYYFRKRHLLSFAIAFYLLHLALVCNIFFDIGATMGERLIYHSSVGFAIAAAYFIVKGFERIRPVAISQKALAGVMCVVVLLAGVKTVARNAAWKNDATLFEADLNTVPNSVLVCSNVAASLISKADEEKTDEGRKKDLRESIDLLNRALHIHHTMVASFMNRGIAYYKLGIMDSAKLNLDSAKTLYPNYPTLPGIYKLIAEDYMRKGWQEYGRAKMYPQAINEFLKGIAIDSSDADLWYNLGGAYYSNQQYNEAVRAWQMTLKIQPGYVKAQQGLSALMNMAAASQQGAKKDAKH
jgi:protein O-mannosyl-transferase